jgi:hypothetical protein
MRRHTLTRRRHRLRQRRGQPDLVGQPDQQRAAGMTDDAIAVRRHDYLVQRRPILHHEGVLLS